MKKLFRLVLIMAWLSGWSARKEITIPVVTTEQTDLNIEVNVTYESGMKSDFADVRFTDSDGITELYHFRDNYTTSTSALFVIKIPVSPVAGKTIYLYFGNASAVTASDGANTFPFFEDFSGDLSKWQIFNSPHVYIESGMAKLDYGQSKLRSLTLFTALYYSMVAKLYTSHQYAGFDCMGIAFSYSNPDTAGIMTYWHNSAFTGHPNGDAYFIDSTARLGNASYLTSKIPASLPMVRVRIERTDATHSKFYYGSDSPLVVTHASYTRNDARLWVYTKGQATSHCICADDIYVMKHPQDGTTPASVTPSLVTTYAGKLWRATKLAYQPNGETWGTASVPGENDEVKAISFGPLLQVQDVIPDPCSGWIFHTYFIMARKHVRPEIEIPLRYSGRFWSFVAQLMGADSVSGSDPYTHLMTLIEAIDGANFYGTLAASFGTVATGIVEWPSFKPVGFSISGPDEGGFMSLAVRGIGDRIETDGGAATTYANMTAVTHIQQSSALPLRVPFGGLRLRMNDQSGVALSSSDYVKVKRVAFDFERTFAEEFCSRALQSRQWETDEPIEDGIPDTKMILILPDLETSRLKTHADGTLKKADLYFQLNDNYDVLIELPSLQPIPAPVSRKGQGRTSHEIAYAAARSVSNPTGMAFADWRLTLRDGWGTSYIATT